jgi:hypothetical protein
LQSADYLAYEYRKAIADRISKGVQAHRKSLQALLGRPLEIAGFEGAFGIAKFCTAHNVKRRHPDSQLYDKFR